MSKVQSVKFLFVLWVVLFGGSLAFRFLSPGGEPLDIALGRGVSLIFAQVLAAGAALVCWRNAVTLPKGATIRRLGQTPLVVTLLLFAFVAWSIVQAVRQGGH